MPDGMSSYAATATIYDWTASQVRRWCVSLVVGVAMRCCFSDKSLRLQDTLVGKLHHVRYTAWRLRY